MAVRNGTNRFGEVLRVRRSFERWLNMTVHPGTSRNETISPALSKVGTLTSQNGLRSCAEESAMDTNTLLIILIVLIVLGGGGFYGRGRWF